MPAQLFSREQLSWGQILIIWLGGLCVAIPFALVGYRLVVEGSDRIHAAEMMEERAAFHELGRYTPLEESFRSPRYGSNAIAERIRPQTADSLRRAANSEMAAADRLRPAGTYFRVAGALTLISAVVVIGFLVWRSFHGADRTPRGAPL